MGLSLFCVLFSIGFGAAIYKNWFRYYSIGTLKNGYPEVNSCGVQIPRTLLYKLLLGESSFNEIKTIIEDAMIKYESRSLIKLLFPKEVSYPDSYY